MDAGDAGGLYCCLGSAGHFVRAFHRVGRARRLSARHRTGTCGPSSRSCRSLGVVAYCLLRPPLLQIDRDEQELEIALKQRQLMKYGECANCGYPVEADLRPVPELPSAQLKNLCVRIATMPLSRLGRCALTAPQPGQRPAPGGSSRPACPQAAPRQQRLAASRRVPRNRPNPLPTPSRPIGRLVFFQSASSLP